MKKHFQKIVLVISILFFGNAFSQDKYGDNPDICREKLSEFFEYAKTKDYEYAYQPWLWCFENCPKASKNIYKYGLNIIEDRYQKATGDQKGIEAKMIDKIYEQRIQYFPDNLGKVYSDWALSLEKRGATKEELFEKLEAAFKTDPAQMSIKNLAKYFQEVTDRNKETSPQVVFDTYDDALDAVNKKIDIHTRSKDLLDKIVADGGTLNKKQALKLKNDEINLRGLGQVEGVLDQILGKVATCERLIPLYTKNFEVHKTDAKWLRRAASRLNSKECTEDAIYSKLVEAYVAVEPSPEAYIFLASILQKQGKGTDVTRNINKAIELEQDPYKKAKYLYRLARDMKSRSKSQSRAYARQALKYRPSMGKAYLLIASLYASSANSCGTDELSKRMVFIAAMNKAVMAKKVDPSLTSTANRYIKSYKAQAPDTKLVFGSDYKSGQSYKIGCWIGESVKIP